VFCGRVQREGARRLKDRLGSLCREWRGAFWPGICRSRLSRLIKRPKTMVRGPFEEERELQAGKKERGDRQEHYIRL
jgi:hypothetical protein